MWCSCLPLSDICSAGSAGEQLGAGTGVPLGRTGRLQPAMLGMRMLPVIQETPSVLYSYPSSVYTAGLRGFRGHSAQKAGM